MNRIYLLAQWKSKRNTIHDLKFLGNKTIINGRPAWFSGMPDDYMTETPTETRNWMKAETKLLHSFRLELIYD